MKRLLYHISCLALVILPVLLTVAPAIAQTPVYQGQTTELSIEPNPGDTYTWEIYNDPTINFATVAGTAVADGEASFVDGINTGPTVQVTWLEPGIYFYKVTAVDIAGCTNNLEIGRIEILESLPTAELNLDPNEICINDDALIIVTLTGNPAWEITVEESDLDGNVTGYNTYSGIEADENPYKIAVSPTQTTIYRVVQVKDKYGENLDPSNSVSLTVHPLPAKSKIYLKE